MNIQKLSFSYKCKNTCGSGKAKTINFFNSSGNKWIKYFISSYCNYFYDPSTNTWIEDNYIKTKTEMQGAAAVQLDSDMIWLTGGKKTSDSRQTAFEYYI